MKAKSMLCLSVLAVAVVSICVLTVTAQPFNSWPAEFTGATCGTTECDDCVGGFMPVEIGEGAGECPSGYKCYVADDADSLQWLVCKHTGDAQDECNPWEGEEEGSTKCSKANSYWCDCLPSGGNQNCDFSAAGCNCNGGHDFNEDIEAGSSCVEPT